MWRERKQARGDGAVTETIRVYVAGPYTKGDVGENVHLAIQAGNRLAELGFAPYIPHLNHLWHLQIPHSPQFWYDYDLKWLAVCDCMVRLPGESVGTDAEMTFARQHAIPIYWGVEELRMVVGRMVGL